MLAKKLERDPMNRKIISVSKKRQITIPLKFFEQLGLENEVECFVKDNSLVIRPFRNTHDEFSVEILKELVDQGLSGHELIEQFAVNTKNIKTAIGKMTTEAERIAADEVPAATFDDIFGEKN
jgi:bifunctional DNA-binding transcriptional regulator/antitoxin component of YhaV-PrlF toxin-antitoxin module